jgi:hypothetical protein
MVLYTSTAPPTHLFSDCNSILLNVWRKEVKTI